MKALAGAVVIFAGAVLFAGGAVADAVAEAAKTQNAPGGVLAMVAGAGVGLLGLLFFAYGWQEGPKRRADLNPNDVR